MFLAYLTNLHGCCRHILIYHNAFYKETTELQRQDGKWTATPDKRRPPFSLVRVASGGQAPRWALQDSREAKTRLPSQELTPLCPEFYFFFQRDENVRKQKDHAGPRCRRDEEEKREMTLIYCCCSQNSSSRHRGDQEPRPEASLLPGVANCFQRSPGSQLQANQSPLSARAERATCQGSGETVSLRVPTSGLHQYARGGDTLLFSSM